MRRGAGCERFRLLSFSHLRTLSERPDLIGDLCCNLRFKEEKTEKTQRSKGSKGQHLTSLPLPLSVCKGDEACDELKLLQQDTRKGGPCRPCRAFPPVLLAPRGE